MAMQGEIAVAHGRTIQLFLIDGTATGLKTDEIHNWTGHLLHFPRMRIADALRRDEAERTGIYVLVGPDPDQPARSRIYIGEGDNVSRRLRAHDSEAGKDFWQQACIVTSKDANLTKAHARYLEARLIERAHAAGRAEVENRNGGAPNPLPDSDRADMEYFLEQIETVLPVVRIDALRPKSRVVESQAPDRAAANRSLSLQLKGPRHEVEAHAEENDGGFVVLRGSTASAYDGHTSKQHAETRATLIERGILREDRPGGPLHVTQDTVFRSPSEAATIILNRNANGRTEWKLSGTGQTLKAWQEAQLGAD